MNHPEARIREILTTEYLNFLEYCDLADKKLAGEITSTDYVAFRTQYGVSREIVTSIRNLIENYSPDENKVITLENDNEDNVSSNNNHEKKDVILNQTNFVDHNFLLSNNAEGLDSLGNLDKLLSKEKGNLTLANIVGIEDISKYEDIELSVLDFSVRASNVLLKAKCLTLGDLLNYTLNDLKKLPSAGKKTVENILVVIYEYIETQKEMMKEGTVKDEKQIPCISKNLAQQVQCMLEGKSYTIENLSKVEKSYFFKCLKTKELLGSEICLLAKNGDAGLLNIFQILEQYVKYNDNFNKVRRAFSFISLETLSQPVYPYWMAYEHSILSLYDGKSFQKKHIDYEAYSVLCDKNSLLESMLNKILLEVHTDVGLNDCYKFIQWIDNDFEQLMHEKIIDCLNQKNKKGVEILKLRAKGETLEQIGASNDVSRERIRQLEKKAIFCFMRKYHSNHCDIILIISAIRGGNPVLNKEETQKYLCEEDIEIFWYLITKGQLESWKSWMRKRSRLWN